jgi:hypothetical protein
MTISDKPVDEVVFRPDNDAGWRLEVPDAARPDGVFVTVVAHKQDALQLAADMYPTAHVRVIDDPPGA